MCVVLPMCWHFCCSIVLYDLSTATSMPEPCPREIDSVSDCIDCRINIRLVLAEGCLAMWFGTSQRWNCRMQTRLQRGLHLYSSYGQTPSLFSLDIIYVILNNHSIMRLFQRRNFVQQSNDKDFGSTLWRQSIGMC
jgi:hypothetical protein